MINLNPCHARGHVEPRCTHISFFENTADPVQPASDEVI